MKRKTFWVPFISLVLASVLVALLVPFGVQVKSNGDWLAIGYAKAAEQEEPVGELVEARTATTKTAYLGSGEYSLTSYTGSVHYLDGVEWKDIETSIVPSELPNWDWVVEKGAYQIRIREDTTVALIKEGNWIGFQYVGFAYYDSISKNHVVLQDTQPVVPVVEGNSIRWNGLFYGVNLVYTYTGDRFKEELEVTQVARDWLTAHPPSLYGLDNQTSYLVGYMEVDTSLSFPIEDAEGVLLSFDDLELEGEAIFWRSPVTQKIIQALPIGYAYQVDDILREYQVPIRVRFYKAGTANYLLFGASVLALNQLDVGTIIIDPTLSFNPGASAADSDTRRITDNEAWATIRAGAGTGANGGTTMYTYFSSGASANTWRWLMRPIVCFNTNIGAGVTVTAADLSVYAVSKLMEVARNDFALNVFSSNPADPTSIVAADFQTHGTTQFATDIAYAAVSVAANNTFNFNAAGLAAINTTGVSEFSLRESYYDAAGNVPLYGSAGRDSGVVWYTTEQGAGFQPELTVTYTISGADISNTPPNV
ncbi:hypothetical protein KKF61_08745, partial [Patescibacteria group bacterium]|nr:hypothetical protein [Patescibacteria group bacterium]